MTSVRQVVGEGGSGVRGSSGTSGGWTRTGEGELLRLGDKINSGEMISDSFNFNSSTQPEISMFSLIDTKNRRGVHRYVGVFVNVPSALGRNGGFKDSGCSAAAIRVRQPRVPQQRPQSEFERSEEAHVFTSAPRLSDAL